MKILSTLICITLLLSACNNPSEPQEATMTVSEFKAKGKKFISEKRKWCKDNAAEREGTPNCINASRAALDIFNGVK